MLNNDLILTSVIQPDDSIAGRSQTEWSVNWWRYIYGIPADENHPMSDEIGTKAGTGQSPPVFYFVGTFNESGEVTRNVSIAPNSGYKYLFMPLVNIQWDNEQLQAFYPNIVPENLTNAQIQGFTQAFADTGLSSKEGVLFMSIDGVDVGDLEAHRQTSDVFDYTLADPPNLLGFPSGGTITGSFADGFNVGIDLATLPPTEHTIQFGGVFNLTNIDIPDDLGLEDLENYWQDYGRFSQDFSYTIAFNLHEIVGTNAPDKDNVRGSGRWDDIRGLNGRDYMVGGKGNDILRGGNGVDTLIGTDPHVRHPGAREIDILYGGDSSDIFVLGDTQKIHYKKRELENYALIKNFNTEDTIQLHGSRSSYELSENYSLGGKTGTSIFLRNTFELIGFVQNATELSFTSNDFSFVS